MIGQALALIALFAGVCLSRPLIAEHEDQKPVVCHSVQILIARGTSQKFPGRQGDLAAAICKGVDSCGYSEIVYPATIENYCVSVEAGANTGKLLAAWYTTHCPQTKLVYTGFSQGAHVVGDILGGGGGFIPAFNCTQETTVGLDPSSSLAKKIVAAALFGDIRHTASQIYNAGNGSDYDGMHTRAGAQLASLNGFSSKLRSWCLAGDPVCAADSDIDFEAHKAYFDIFVNEAAAWVKSKL